MEDDGTRPDPEPRTQVPAPPVTVRAGRGGCAECGQLAVGLLLVVAALGLALGVVVTVGRAHLALARARAAADAAALAAAVDGPAAAHRVAEANGGVVVALVERGACIELRVRAGAAEARARARRVFDLPAASGSLDGVVSSVVGPPDGECPLLAAPVP